MRRHEIDVVSLAAGLLFLGVAGVHLVAGATDTDLNLRWMAPLVLVVLGVIGMLAAVRSRRESGTLAEPESPSTAEADVTEEVEETPVQQ